MGKNRISGGARNNYSNPEDADLRDGCQEKDQACQGASLRGATGPGRAQAPGGKGSAEVNKAGTEDRDAIRGSRSLTSAATRAVPF